MQEVIHKRVKDEEEKRFNAQIDEYVKIKTKLEAVVEDLRQEPEKLREEIDSLNKNLGLEKSLRKKIGILREKEVTDWKKKL